MRENSIFVDLTLAQRLELAQAYRAVHYAQAYASLHPTAGSIHQIVASGVAVFISATSPVNKAVGFGLGNRITDDELKQVEEFYISRGAAPVFAVSPLADRDFFQLLTSCGYHIADFLNVLWRPIPSGYKPAPLPDEMRITRTGSEDALLWLDITAQGFEEVEKPSPETYDILGPNFYAPSSACYLAWNGDLPVAGGGMYIYGGVVELGGASTLPHFRRQGAQTALIETRLAAAKDMGCDVGMILTEPGSNSQRNAQRLGFELAYTEIILKK
jgi:hypothetical protein